MERPRSGAQPPLFETRDGWRYSLWVTNRPAATKGWLGQCAYLDAAHRVHARVEDLIRTGKDTGLGHLPSFDYGVNAAWLTAAMIATTLLAWLKLLALDGDLARAEPKTLRYRLLAVPAPSEVFALTFFGTSIPLILIAIMTFVLITSSGTMAMAVNFGYRGDRARATAAQPGIWGGGPDRRARC